MAYLNVRERRLETKIAYVGPAFAGKATNFARLKDDKTRGRVSNVREMEVDGGEVVSLDWTPLLMPRFNDCDVAVNVVAARGALSTDRLGSLFEDVDGVVFVVDATPSAQPENRRMFELVRDALAQENVKRPVVVQLNKSDIDGAVSAVDLRAALEIEWPVVAANAAQGKGVVETLETALANVIELMKTREAQSGEVKADTNPLLTALRQILRETVTEHMATLERETMARVAGSLASGPSETKPDPVTQARFDRIERALEHVQATLNRFGDSFERLAAGLDALGATAHSTVNHLAAMQVGAHEHVTHDELAAFEARMREELASRGKADRDHVTSAAAVLRRNIESIGVDIKKSDIREQVAAMVSVVQLVHERSEELKATLAPAVLGLPPRITNLEATIHRQMRDTFEPVLTRIEDTVQVLQLETGESLASTDARTTEIHKTLTELLEDLKKRKKGWFS